MKHKDMIRLFGHAMLVEYGATGQTGSISVLRLDREVRFAIEGDAIRASYVSDPSPALVERFASPELAKNAYQHLQSVIKRYVFLRRVRNGAARLTLWGVAPVVVTILALSMNLAVTRGMEVHAATLAPAATAGVPAAGTVMVAAAAQSVPPPAEVAKAMQDGVRSGRFSIELSHGPKGTMYVFSDPACGYCRALEPQLAKLARDYTIHLFPVSVTGGQGSSNAISGLMCHDMARRASEWKSLIASRSTTTPPCRDGDEAIAANDRIFEALRLHGTPAIIGNDGTVYPNVGTTTDASIQRWMKRTGQ